MTKTRNNRKSNFRQTKRKRGGGNNPSQSKSTSFDPKKLVEARERRQKKEEQEAAAERKKKSAMYQSFAEDAAKKEKEDAEQKAKSRNARKKSAKQKKNTNKSLDSAVSQLPLVLESPESSSPSLPLVLESPKSSSPSQLPLDLESPKYQSSSLAALPPTPPKSKSPSLTELPPPPPTSKREKTPARQAKRALKLALKQLAEELETTRNTCISVKDVFYINKETDKQADKLLQVNLCKCIFILGRVSQILEDFNYKFMLVLKGTRAMLLATKERPEILARLKPTRPGASALDNNLFETLDIDGTLQLRDGVETPESREERKALATDIFVLIQKHIGEDKISILQPMAETPDDTVETIGARVVKLSYKKPDGGITAISDLGFSQITHGYYTGEFQETQVEAHKLHYRFPSLEDQEREKEAFLEQFKQQWADGDHSDKSLFNIQHFTRNLNKIRTLLGKEPIEMPSSRPVQTVEQLQTKKAGLERLLAMQTDEEKRKLIVEQLDSINEQLK